jgi:NAD(P)-dependent dehydrogenase (short-subunit alcohol dehydrogenase family)
MKIRKNWVVLITGCSSGLGRALALEFAKKGHIVFATARRIEDLCDLISPKITTLQLDVTNATSIATAIQKIGEQSGRIDLLINNAGFGLMGPLAEVPLDEVRRQFETNVVGPLALVQAVVPYMVKQGGGRIVNMGSVSGVLTTPFAGAYCASKAALHSLSDAMRLELAPFGIEVINLQPSQIASKFGDTAIRILKESSRSNSHYLPIFHFVEMRAKASQNDATEATEFARHVVDAITRKKPPLLLRFGKNSWKMPACKWALPLTVIDRMLSRMFGLHLLRQHPNSLRD